MAFTTGKEFVEMLEGVVEGMDPDQCQAVKLFNPKTGTWYKIEKMSRFGMEPSFTIVLEEISP
jgi:hypothetical protein